MTNFVIVAAIVVLVVGGFVVFAKSGKRGSGGVARVFSRGSQSSGGDTDNIEI
tara:strand:- start:5521 stop:5679 length:159 start_codon:yes stop_codon:yes gene_type:complete